MDDVTWWAYVQRTAAESNANIARRIGVTPSSISRWGKGSLPDPTQAAAFARAYGRPVLEAFIAASFLTAEEAGEKPSAPLPLESLDDDTLIGELHRRLQSVSDAEMNELWNRYDEERDAEAKLTATQDDVVPAARETKSRGKALMGQLDELGEESQE